MSLLVVTAGLLAAATPAMSQTQRARTQGWNMGAALNGSAIKLDDSDFESSDTDNGGGLSLYGGYNFTPNLGIFLGITGASIQPKDGDSYGLGHGDLGVRLSLGTSAAVPYVEAAYSGIDARVDGGEDGDVELQGTGFTGAIGLNYFMTQRVALDVNFMYTKGEFNTVKVGGDSVSSDDGVGVATGRFNIGIAFYPSAGKQRTAMMKR
jgi:hypothetical protein